jgi:hypothetical protein
MAVASAHKEKMAALFTAVWTWFIEASGWIARRGSMRSPQPVQSCLERIFAVRPMDESDMKFFFRLISDFALLG